MNTVVSTILRANSRKESELLNILTYQYKNETTEFICSTGHNIYLIQNQQVRWDFSRPTPPNLNLLDFTRGDKQIPLWLDVDLVFCPSRNSSFIMPILQISMLYHLPVLLMEDTPLNNRPNAETIEQARRMQGDINVFQTQFIRDSWLFHNDLNSSILTYEKKHLERWKFLINECSKTIYTGQRHYDV